MHCLGRWSLAARGTERLTGPRQTRDTWVTVQRMLDSEGFVQKKGNTALVTCHSEKMLDLSG